MSIGASLASFPDVDVNPVDNLSRSTLIVVSPPKEFSAEYDVNTTFDESIISRSFTLPKSPKLMSNAPVNKDEPMLLESFLPWVALYSKSNAKGPIFISDEEPAKTNVHSPESSGNSKVQSLWIPGPRLVTPSCEWCFAPRCVITATSRPPIGTGASFVIDTLAITTSSSSSLMSILMSITSA